MTSSVRVKNCTNSWAFKKLHFVENKLTIPTNLINSFHTKPKSKTSPKNVNKIQFLCYSSYPLFDRSTDLQSEIGVVVFHISILLICIHSTHPEFVYALHYDTSGIKSVPLFDLPWLWLVNSRRYTSQGSGLFRITQEVSNGWKLLISQVGVTKNGVFS